MGDIDSGSTVSGKAGRISLTTTTGKIEVKNLSAGSVQGDGNNIVLNSALGITTQNLSTKSGGIAGNVSITAVNDIKVGDIEANSTLSGKGGIINLTTTAGGIETNNLSSGAIQGDGNSIILKAALGVTTQDLNTSSTQGNSGKIAIVATNEITTGAIVSAADGNAGAVTLTANGDIVTNGIQAQSNNVGSGGTVKVTSQSGKIDMNGGQVSTYAINGTGGKVTLTANQTIAVGEINTYASFGKAGEVIVEANGDITTTTIYASAFGGDANNIRLTSVNGGIDTNNLEISATSLSGGNAGNVTLRAAKDIKVGDIFARSREEITGVWNGGKVTLEASGAIEAGNVTTTSLTGNAGNVRFDANLGILVGNGIKVGNIDAWANNNGNAGSVKLNAVNDIEALVIKSNVNGTGIGIAGDAYILDFGLEKEKKAAGAWHKLPKEQ
ncbi:hypothetical protein TUMEXPCC7403_25680 [Tumidithrix helvetica PCC 7403]|uniref:beta strand repeat-containing protein n=1 Tax=Tumidithrix helvetica TaxID=3457545 RepID=UPI003C88D6F0